MHACHPLQVAYANSLTILRAGALCSCQETANSSFRRIVQADKFVECCSLPSYREYIAQSSWKELRGRPSSYEYLQVLFLGIVSGRPCVYNTASGQRPALRAGAMNHVRKHLRARMCRVNFDQSTHHCLVFQKRKTYHHN